MSWTETWPIEQGWYWFYGWCWRSAYDEPAELHLVKVRLGQKRHPFYVTNGHFVWKGEGAIGWWKDAELPEVPMFEWNRG